MAYASTAKYGTATNPQLGASVVSITSVRAGRYKVSVLTKPSGTLTTADADNVQLTYPGGTVSTCMMGSANGTATLNPEVYVDFVAAGSISVVAVANASGTAAVYGALLVLTPEALY